MELKGGSRLCKTNPLLFQSHLYGIERSFNNNSFLISLSFNRTFMELKARNVYWGACASTFQSHLYGIESYGKAGKSPRSTSFNRTFMELKACREGKNMPSDPFQSHLYGIERQVIPPFLCLVQVSIAPLWNWKSSATCSVQERLRAFQSHLYGIESWQNRHSKTLD